jgi:hypothetical protein
MMPPLLFGVVATASAGGGDGWGLPYFLGMGGGARAPQNALQGQHRALPVQESVAAATGDAAGGIRGEAQRAGRECAEGVKDSAGAYIAGEIIAHQRETNKQAKQAKSKS